jgi:4-hydroxy-tetrahydrodipicolinate reductase
MGKAIEQVALASGHEIVVRINSADDWENFGSLLSSVDVAIEFSSADVVVSNILRCFEANVPVVVGTTAWENQLESIRETCLRGNHSMFTASNFSIGVNIFNKINRNLAELMNTQLQYDTKITETHHVHKTDSPSGTAKLLANEILKQVDRKHGWVNQESANTGELGIISHRIDEVPGTHLVTWFSDEDEIEIKHTAKNRFGFAKGALMAACWLPGKTGFFGMDDLLIG